MLLPGDGGAAAGAIDDATSNRKSISELLSLDPHDNNVSLFLWVGPCKVFM